MRLKNKLIIGVTAAGLAFGSYSPASAVTLKGETASPGCPYTVFIMTAKYASKAGINIQVSDGKTLTKSMLLMAQKKLDISSTVLAATVFMSKGVAMYKKLGKKAVAMHKKLRGRFSYQCGLYNMIVWDENKEEYIARLLPYGSDTSSPVIDVPNVAGFKKEGVDKASKQFNAELEDLKSKIKKFYNSVMVRSDLVIAGSNFIFSHINENYEKFFSQKKRKLLVIFRGINTNYFHSKKILPVKLEKFSKEHEINRNNFVILLPGRLTSWKGQKVFIEAIKILSQMEVTQSFEAIILGSEHGRNVYKKQLVDRKSTRLNSSHW